MKQLIKSTVYIPVNEGDSEMSVSYWERDIHIVDVKEESGYFFTPEQLNEYTANVIKQALETAANSKSTYIKVDLDGRRTHPTGLCKESIIKTFNQIFEKFKV